MTTTTHTWTARQISFLRKNARKSGPELCQLFRRTFRRASGELTDKAIVNRRYVLLNAAGRKEYAAGRRERIAAARQFNAALFV